MNQIKKSRTSLLAAWAGIEKTLPARGSLEYQLAWGTAREKFYSTIGYIPCSSEEVERLRKLKGIFSGERVFVLGNGPSLNKTPLHLLENEFTFVTNRAYLLYDKINWRPSFYTTLDWRVVPDIAHEINVLNGMVCFFEERFNGILREGDDVFWYTHTPPLTPDEKRFAYNIDLGIRGAGSVTGSAIQIAFYLGFSEIYLIGCDLGYKVNSSVKQEGEDVFGTGTKLFLTSTENDDPNHFDKRYFGKGRRWHDPNVARMISGHEQCKAGILSAGGKIFNATVGGELEVYERVDFNSLFETDTANETPRMNLKRIVQKTEPIYPFVTSKPEVVGPFLRCEKSHLDETDVIFDYLSSLNKKGTMIDVGAHRGSSSVEFLNSGWKIFAFEPDPANRAGLINMIKASRFPDNISIDNRAVGDINKSNVPFFTSEQSSGISGLSSFHSSHKQTYKVDIITLRDFLSDKPLSSVDFLKIDTEGHDFFVLKGFPWERFSPSVIECEFEDSKTLPLGYTYKDLADYLVGKGYHVYVSEWHPIVRYGIRHDWRSLTPYPTELFDTKGWGNFIAFKDFPNEKLLAKSLKSVLTVGEITGPGKAKPKTKPKDRFSIIKNKEITFSRWIAGPNFQKLTDDQWYYSKVEQKNSFLSAIFDVSQEPGKHFIGAITLKMTTPMKVNISIGRVGTTKYEGYCKTVLLEPNTDITVFVTHKFKRSFNSIKLQIELLCSADSIDADLSIKQVSLSVSVSEHVSKSSDSMVEFKLANKLYRNDEYLKALCIYLAKYDQNKLNIYKMNALMAARKLGFEQEASLEQIRSQSDGFT